MGRGRTKIFWGTSILLFLIRGRREEEKRFYIFQFNRNDCGEIYTCRNIFSCEVISRRESDESKKINQDDFS